MIIPNKKPAPIYGPDYYSKEELSFLLTIVEHQSLRYSIVDPESLKKWWDDGWKQAAITNIGSMRYNFQMSYFAGRDEFGSYYVLYCLPIEALPLLINDDDSLIVKLAKWRLSISK